MSDKPKVRIEKYLRESVLNDVVELEKRVWRKEGYREVNAPMLYFELAYLTNGLVLTAFDDGVYTRDERAKMAEEDPWYAGDRPIGFLACFADFDRRGPFWYGARMGVDRRYWDKNIGDELVKILYECARERGIHRIRWTYDPLVSRNGYIYIHRMGATVREIGFNYYSAVFTSDEFNRGISTDRLIVEWQINSDRVRERIEKGILPSLYDASEITPENTINSVEMDEQGLEKPGEKLVFNLTVSPLFMEIPYDQDKLLKADRAKAQILRDKIRGLFMHYLARGYAVKGFVVKKEADGRRRPFYRLERDAEWRFLNL
jgi:predicted GNAT superfamily acetyltransferase